MKPMVGIIGSQGSRRVADSLRKSLEAKSDVRNPRVPGGHRAHPAKPETRVNRQTVDSGLGPDDELRYGLMFWFTWKTFSGSYFRLICTSRS